MRHHIGRALTRVALLMSASLLLAVGQAAASPVAQASGGTQYGLNIVAHDNGATTGFHGSFDMPDSVHAGRVEITFTNDGSVEHMAQLFKLNPGVSESKFIGEFDELITSKTPSQTVQALHEVLAIASAWGGANGEQPGAREEVIEHLVPGNYVVICLETTPKGVPHFLLGMAHTLTVWGNDTFTTPDSNGTVIETDHEIILPSIITHSRPMTLRIDVSSQTHEFEIASVPTGTTKAQLLACLTGGTCTLKASPVDVTGAGAIHPGASHWIELNLKPGTYVAWCFVPDIHTGMPHALMGMLTVFVVN